MEAMLLAEVHGHPTAAADSDTPSQGNPTRKTFGVWDSEQAS